MIVHVLLIWNNLNLNWSQTIQQFGGIDILVSNAAANPVFGPVLQVCWYNMYMYYICYNFENFTINAMMKDSWLCFWLPVSSFRLQQQQQFFIWP